MFGFVQFEFGFLLGPPDGRYLIRTSPDVDPERVLVIATLGAIPRRLLRGRRGSMVTEGAPEPVPTGRVTVVRAQPFEGGQDEAQAWLDELRAEGELAAEEFDDAITYVNRAMHAHRVARNDPHARDVAYEGALVTRIGYGLGDEVADGEFTEAWELPRRGVARAKRTMESPDERFAALVGGREYAMACEELILRARADLDGDRRREAALECRVALEALLAELPEIPGNRRPPLEEDRRPVGAAANAALAGPVPDDLAEDVTACLGRLEAALRAHRLSLAVQRQTDTQRRS